MQELAFSFDIEDLDRFAGEITSGDLLGVNETAKMLDIEDVEDLRIWARDGLVPCAMLRVF